MTILYNIYSSDITMKFCIIYIHNENFSETFGLFLIITIFSIIEKKKNFSNHLTLLLQPFKISDWLIQQPLSLLIIPNVAALLLVVPWMAAAVSTEILTDPL